MKTTPFSQETFVGFKIQNLWIAKEEDSFEYWNLRLKECETVLTIPRVFFFFFNRTARHVGSYLLDWGLNPCSLQWKCRFLSI